MEFKIIGADANTGRDIQIVVSAGDFLEAQAIAAGKGIVVRKIVPAEAPPPPAGAFCRHCGQPMSKAAAQCPKCGAVADAQAALEPLSDKSRIAYILLGVFLGTLGIHNFYAGYTGRAVAQLLITVLTCGIGSIISWVWMLVEVCTVTQDAGGRKLS